MALKKGKFSQADYICATILIETRTRHTLSKVLKKSLIQILNNPLKTLKKLTCNPDQFFVNQLRVRRRVLALVAAAAARRRSIQGSKNHLVVFLSSDRRQENLVDVNLTSKKSCYRLLLHTQLVTCSSTHCQSQVSLFFLLFCVRYCCGPFFL